MVGNGGWGPILLRSPYSRIKCRTRKFFREGRTRWWEEQYEKNKRVYTFYLFPLHITQYLTSKITKEKKKTHHATRSQTIFNQGGSHAFHLHLLIECIHTACFSFFSSKWLRTYSDRLMSVCLTAVSMSVRKFYCSYFHLLYLNICISMPAVSTKLDPDP